MPDVLTKYTIFKSVFKSGIGHSIDEDIRIRLTEKERVMNEFLVDPGVNNDSVELLLNDPPKPGNEQDYTGLMESLRRRHTNDQTN